MKKLLKNIIIFFIITTITSCSDEDNFPNTASNGQGTDLGDYNLWICIKLSSPTFGHN